MSGKPGSEQVNFNQTDITNSSSKLTQKEVSGEPQQAEQSIGNTQTDSRSTSEDILRTDENSVRNSLPQTNNQRAANFQSSRHQIQAEAVKSENSQNNLNLSSHSYHQRRNRADRAKSGMLPVTRHSKPKRLTNPFEAMIRPSVMKRQTVPSPISLSMLRVRQQNYHVSDLLAVDESQMLLALKSNDDADGQKKQVISATRSVSNDAWFDKFAIDKTIAKAMKNGYNVCFMVYGQKGSGKDYCLTGGVVQKPAQTEQATPEFQADNQENLMESLAFKQREPGLIRLAYEAIIAQICVNKNAQYTIQLTCGLICNEEMEDLLQAESAASGDFDDTQTRQTHMPGSSTERLTRRHCNGIKQLTQLLQQIQFRREQLQPKNETLIYELVIERFSLDPADYDTRTTLSKICFLRLPPSELLQVDPRANAFQQSLHRIQSRSLLGFFHHVLKQAENNVAAKEASLNCKLISYLIDEAYFDFQEDKDTSDEHQQVIVEPISDLCFICCLTESTALQPRDVNTSIRLVETLRDTKVCPQMTVLSPGKSVIESLQRQRRIKTTLIDAIVEKMQSRATAAHTEEFQQLFYDRIRHNKQLQNYESNILTSDSFKKSIAEVKLFERTSGLQRDSINSQLPPVPKIKSEIALGSNRKQSSLMLQNNLITDEGQRDDSTSFYSNTFSTLSLANTSGVPANQTQRLSAVEPPRQYLMRNNSMIELNNKRSNASNRLSIRFRNAVSFQQDEQMQVRPNLGDQDEESKQPFNISPQVAAEHALDQSQVMMMRHNESYLNRSSVQSSATDVTAIRGVNQSTRIGYGEDHSIKLEALLFDDTQECLTKELIANRKSPNRIGTSYEQAFVQRALTIPSQSKNVVQESATIKMFPKKKEEQQVENESQIDERFRLSRRSSNGFYEPQTGYTRHSVPINSKAKTKPLGDHADDSVSDSESDKNLSELGRSNTEKQVAGRVVEQQIDDDFFNQSRKTANQSQSVKEKRTNSIEEKQPAVKTADVHESKEAWEDLIDDDDCGQVIQVRDEQNDAKTVQILEQIKPERTQSDAAMFQLLNRNNLPPVIKTTETQGQARGSNQFSSAEVRTEEGQEAFESAVKEDDGFEHTLAELLFDAEQNQEQFDVEDFLLGDEKDSQYQAEFMVRNRAALDRLKSIRLSSRMSNSRLSQRIARFSLSQYKIEQKKADASSTAGLGSSGILQQSVPQMRSPSLMATNTENSLAMQENGSIITGANALASRQDSTYFKNNYLTMNESCVSEVSQPPSAQKQSTMIGMSQDRTPQPQSSTTELDSEQNSQQPQATFNKQFTNCGAQPFEEEQHMLVSQDTMTAMAEDMDVSMMQQMDRLIMMERERVLKQADQKMAKIEKTHRDSILRGRGYSLKLGTANVIKGVGNAPESIAEEESMSPSGLLLDMDDDVDGDDFLLDGADEDMLLEDFDKDISGKLVSFDKALENGQKQTLGADALHPSIVRKQDSAEVLSEDISESETPRSLAAGNSNIGKGLSKQRGAQSAKSQKHVIMKPKVMKTQNSLKSAIGSGVLVQPSQEGKSSQKTLMSQARDAAACKKCKSMKKVKKQLKEKTACLVETQDKLSIAEIEIQRLRTQLKEVHQYIEVLEKQNQQIQLQAQANAPTNSNGANSNNGAPNVIGDQARLAQARNWYEKQLRMSTIIEGELNEESDNMEYDDEDEHHSHSDY